MKNGYYVTRTYESGGIGEKIRFWVPGERPSRSQRRISSELKKQKWNDGNAVRKLARTIQASFRPGKDLLVGLSYDEKHLPDDLAGAKKRVRCWLERARRACKAAGVELKYVVVTSDLDGATGEVVRLHHHVVINAEAAEIALGKWTEGETHREHLTREKDKLRLAKYLLEQVRREEPEEKKYIPSRNLTKVLPKDRITSGAEVRMPKGCVLLERSEWVPGRPQYIRYLLAEKREEYL